MNESWLRCFQWYRRKVGGYWTHSYALGWRTLPDWSADMDLEFSKRRPDLYRNGRDVEDYRQKEPFAMTPDNREEQVR